MSKKKPIRKRILAIVVLSLVVIAVVVYLVVKNLVSADTTSINYPSWIDPVVVQQAGSWNASQESALLGCLQTGTVTISTPTTAEITALGSKAKAFIVSTGLADTQGTSFYTDKFRIALAPTKFQDNNDGLSYTAAYKYLVTNPNTLPIFLQKAQLRFSFFGIPIGDPASSFQPGDSTSVFNNQTEVKLTAGQSYTGTTANIRVSYGATYSTIWFGTRVYSTSAAGDVTYGGDGSSGVACIADPFSINSMSNGNFPQQVASLPSWFDSQTVNNYNNVWTINQKTYLSGAIGTGKKSLISVPASQSSTFGSDAVAFSAGNNYMDIASSSLDSVKDHFALIVKKVKFDKQANGSYKVQFMLGLGNNQSTSISLSDADLRMVFYSVDKPEGYTSGITDPLMLNNGDQFTLQPGQFVNITTPEFIVTNPAYYYVEFASALRRNDGSFDQSGGALNFQVPNPISLSAMGAVIDTPTPTPSVTNSVVSSPSPTTSTTPSTTPNSYDITFPHGFSAFGNTKTVDKGLFSAAGLYLYKFDGANNKWLLYPGSDSFDATEWQGYYVYNPSTSPKTITIPFSVNIANMYAVTKGWNMLYSTNSKPTSAVQLQLNSTTSGSMNDYISQGLVSSRIFIIDNDRATDSCSYFKLWSDTDNSANCSASPQVLGTDSQIPAGKTFWVYVK